MVVIVLLENIISIRIIAGLLSLIGFLIQCSPASDVNSSTAIAVHATLTSQSAACLWICVNDLFFSFDINHRYNLKLIKVASCFISALANSLSLISARIIYNGDSNVLTRRETTWAMTIAGLVGNWEEIYAALHLLGNLLMPVLKTFSMVLKQTVNLLARAIRSSIRGLECVVGCLVEWKKVVYMKLLYWRSGPGVDEVVEEGRGRRKSRHRKRSQKRRP